MTHRQKKTQTQLPTQNTQAKKIHNYLDKKLKQQQNTDTKTR